MRDVGDKTVKAVDRAADLSEHMKKALVRTTDQAQNLADTEQVTPSEYASDKLQYGVEDIVTEAGHIVVDAGKGAYRTGKSAFQKKQQIQGLLRRRNNSIKAHHKVERSIKQSPRTAEQSAKTLQRSVKDTQKAVKTAEHSSKVAIKTAQETAKATQKSAQAAAKAAEKAVRIAQATARAAAAAAKAAAKAVVAAVKAIIAAVKELVAAIAAGGWVAVVIIIVIMLVALIVGSCFGIFFSSADTGSPMTMQSVVREINAEYQSTLDSIRSMTVYDKLETSGSRAVWPEVLAVYAVALNTDPDNPQNVATMDESKKAILQGIFWQMNQINYWIDSKEEVVLIEEADQSGNIITTETTMIVTTLYIKVSHKTAATMASEYGFSTEQIQMINELLLEENASMWSAVLYGIHSADEQIVAVAESQIGNVGGQPYWSWFGYGSRVEWCACFVSWCANECGYIDAGIIPKFAGCVGFVNWFKERGQWADRNATPVPGMIIFFDWVLPDAETGTQNGLSDHVGIVQKVEDGYVYTIEGNVSDSCGQRKHKIGHHEILGYGIPAY